MLFFPFLCSAIPDLDSGLLKMLISVIIYSKYLIFTSISHVQESFKLSEVNHE